MATASSASASEATPAPSHMIEAAIYGYAEKSRSEHSTASYTVYNIVVFNRATNAVSRFSKRYSEFYVLHEKLRVLDDDFAAFRFPPKKSAFAGNKNKLAVERKAAFNDYLALLLSKDPLPTEFREFLGLSAIPDVVTTTANNTKPSGSGGLGGMMGLSMGLGNNQKNVTQIINVRPKTAMQLSKEMEAANAREAAVRLKQQADEAAIAAMQAIAAVNASTIGIETSTTGNSPGKQGGKDNTSEQGPVIIKGREVKSTGRVFSGKAKKKVVGKWEKWKVPMAIGLAVIVLLVGGLCAMYFMTDDTVAVKHSMSDRLNNLAATQSFDSLMRGDSLLESPSTDSISESTDLSSSSSMVENSMKEGPTSEDSPPSTTLLTGKDAETSSTIGSIPNKNRGVEGGGGKKKKRRKESGGTSIPGEPGGSTKKKKRRKVPKVVGGEGGGVGDGKEETSGSAIEVGTESRIEKGEKEGGIGMERDLREISQHEDERESILESGKNEMDGVKAGGDVEAKDSTGVSVTEGLVMGVSDHSQKEEASASETVQGPGLGGSEANTVVVESSTASVVDISLTEPQLGKAQETGLGKVKEAGIGEESLGKKMGHRKNRVFGTNGDSGAGAGASTATTTGEGIDRSAIQGRGKGSRGRRRKADGSGMGAPVSGSQTDTSATTNVSPGIIQKILIFLNNVFISVGTAILTFTKRSRFNRYLAAFLVIIVGLLALFIPAMVKSVRHWMQPSYSHHSNNNNDSNNNDSNNKNHRKGDNQGTKNTSIPSNERGGELEMTPTSSSPSSSSSFSGSGIGIASKSGLVQPSTQAPGLAPPRMGGTHRRIISPAKSNFAMINSSSQRTMNEIYDETFKETNHNVRHSHHNNSDNSSDKYNNHHNDSEKISTFPISTRQETITPQDEGSSSSSSSSSSIHPSSISNDMVG